MFLLNEIFTVFLDQMSSFQKHVKILIALFSFYILLQLRCYSAVELDVYNNIAEIKQPLTRNKYTFTYDEWTEILDDYIGVNGVDNYTLNIAEKRNNDVNTTVYIREDSCIYDDNDFDYRKVILVNPDSDLVFDESTGRYFYPEFKRIEYLSPPSSAVTEVEVVMKERPDPESMQFYYLTRSTKWTPFHTLNMFDNGTAKFETRAKITNSLKSPINCEAANLISTDLNLLQQKFYNDYLYHHPPPYLGYEGNVATDNIGNVIKYQINRHFTVPSNGYAILNLVNECLSVQEVRKASVYLYAGERKGKMEKVVVMKPHFFIPNGNLIVKRNGWITGSTKIPKVSADEEYYLHVGTDDQVSYSQTVRIKDEENSKQNVIIEILLTNYNKHQNAHVIYDIVILNGYISGLKTDHIRFITYRDNKITIEFQLNPSSVETLNIEFVKNMPRQS